ncbi:DUF930 domain-containing protein [Rhizobium terrae]|uniref:DUF930 domain-containing protein n=1 Tax=Rhizobium terrae TaxID=2171756 RepID=UPI001D021E5A|nr:DUF930 domain-containing protein [Rhizobium terrae]
MYGFDPTGLDPAEFPSYIGSMEDENESRPSTGKGGGMGWGIPASILLHAVFAFVLFFHLPLDFSEPPKEESVNVEIVPPPEEPEKKVEEEKPSEEPKAEEAKKEEPPPEPPEPPKQEEAKQEPSPPQEEAKPEEPPANERAKKPQPVQTLRDVFEFGEKDGGPRITTEGNSAREAATQPEDVKPEAENVETVQPSMEEPAVAETPPGNPVPEDIRLPEVRLGAANPQQNGSPREILPDAMKLEMVSPPPASPKAEPVKTPTIEKTSELTEAKTLFSQHLTNDLTATIAMAGMPRDFRGGELCSTELRAQLRSASYNVEFVPRPRLANGMVLDIKQAAFRASGQWYDVAFRCEVNEGVTKILSFAYHIGAPIPRDQWQKRGFPAF